MSSAYLELPPLDTSLGLFDEPPKDPAPPKASTLAAKRKRLPTIRTSLSLTPAELPHVPLEHAAAAVAHALGVNLSDLEPRATSQTRASCDEPRRTSSVYETTPEFALDDPADHSIEERFSFAVAETLGLDSDSVPRDESFLELGGSPRAARSLRESCMRIGLAVKTRDILSCKTMAELETRVTPMSAYSQAAAPFVVSPLQISPPRSLFYSSSRSLSLSHSSVTSLRGPSLRGNPPPVQPKASRRYHNRVEQTLALCSQVTKACVVKPKAGLFEGQIVAFVSLATCAVEGSNDCDIKLLNAYHTGPLPSIRAAVEEKVPPTMVPEVWVVLERLPLDESGRINRRSLQTWIQNANEDLHGQIMSIETQDTVTEPVTDIERQLHSAVSKVLNLDPKSVGMNMSFTKLGGDPTKAMQLIVRCKSQGLSLRSEDILRALSLAQLTTLATSKNGWAGNSAEEDAADFALSPMQRLYFHTVMGNKASRRALRHGSYRFNQSMLVRLNKSIGLEDVRAAIEAVAGHHAMLRTRFRPIGATWSQFTLADIPSSYHFDHHTVGTNEEVEGVIKQAQASIDIEHGPVFAAHHFYTHDGHQMLYLVAHHLVTDLKSWQIIARDLEELLTNGSLASDHLMSFQAWSGCQRRNVRNTVGAGEAPFKMAPADWGYWGVDSDHNSYGNTAAYSFTLSSDSTSLLEESNNALRTESSDIFIAALLLSFRQTFRERAAPAIWNQEHDRALLGSQMDISETVGWLTSLCPVALEVSPADDLLHVLCRVKDARRALDQRGVPYFAANLMDAATAEAFTSSLCPLEIIFTYAGIMQNNERPGSILTQLPVPGESLSSEAADIGPSVGRVALFEVSAAIEYGETKVKFLCNQESRHRDRIQAWIHSYESLLRSAIHRLSSQSPALSMSDLPFVDISYDGLTKMNLEILPSLHIDIANIETVCPVTPNQQNVLINETLTPGSSLMQAIYDLGGDEGAVNVSRICAAWQQITERHSALRTVFSDSVSNHDLYDQIILRRHSPNMLFIESTNAGEALKAVENCTPPTLVKGTPWHRLVVCQAPGRVLLKLEITQALCDPSSVVILFQELEQVYFHQSIPAASEVCFPEYRQCLKITPISTDFWRELAKDVPPCLFPTLMLDRSSTRQYESLSVDLGIPHRSLQAFSRKYKVGVAALLKVAWGIVLRAYVGSDIVCFGYRTSGRDLPVGGLSEAVGCFSNMLFCRLALPSSQFLVQAVFDSESIHREALNHQHMPIGNFQHSPETKGAKRFNSCLTFGYETTAAIKDESRFRPLKTVQSSEYDVHVDVNIRNNNVTVDLGHRILGSDQGRHIAHVFGKAIQSIIQAPESTVNDVDLFTEHDHKQILQWNGRSKPATPSDYVHQLIARQAVENPDMQAVCAWDGDLTYGELDESVMTVASHLRKCGVDAKSLVPVISDKSRWAVVAMLAVLNAGGILVPVDAELPFMFSWVIKNVGAKVMLASESVRRYLEHNVGCDVVYVNESTVEALASQPVTVTPPQTRPLDTACLLLGHEGAKTRKGITYTHHALAVACAGQGPALRLNPSSRVMQISSYSTDVALSEIFTTLIHGGCVCVPSAVERTADFTSAALRMRVNWSYMTPTLSRRIRPENLAGLAVVCFRTLDLDEDTYTPWAGRTKVLLAYGSSEVCPLALSTWEIKDVGALRCIGTPFCGNYWIVNAEDSNRLAPVGAVGALIVQSDTLADGHKVKEGDSTRWLGKVAGRSSRNGEKPGRLLRTGHYVRYTEHGQVEFVSSQSGRVEIDGHSFSPSEVEAALRRCLGRGVDVVVETIAFSYQDSNSTPILAAFIELKDSLFDEREELTGLSQSTKEKLNSVKQIAQMALRDTLPDYMVPAAFIPVRQIPLTPSLEVSGRDLQKRIAGLSRHQLLNLAEVDNTQAMPMAGFSPLPLTGVEGQMRSLWADALGLDASLITANDGFIRLGGSIDRAHDLVIACRRQGIAISAVDLLRDMSLAEVCRTIAIPSSPVSRPSSGALPLVSSSGGGGTSSSADAMAPRLAIDPSTIEDAAEATTLQTIFVESGMLGSLGDVNWFALHITGAVERHRLEHACGLLVDTHPILRTAFASHDGKLWQVVLGPSRPDFQRYQCPGWRLSAAAGKMVKKEQAEGVDFRRPVTKFTFLDSGKSSILLLRLSRAQYDDTTLTALVRDLGRFYEHGESSSRPRARGFCHVVRAAERSFTAHDGATINYWRNLLRGSQMTHVVSQPAPEVATSQSPRTIYQQIPTGAVKNLGIPFETVLKGAWAVVLSNLSGLDDVVFGQLVEGPTDSKSRGVVGPCEGVVPVRAKIPKEPVTPYEYFGAIQSQHVESAPHGSMALGPLVRLCTDWRAWTRFSSVVQHLGSPSRCESLASLSLGSTASCRLSCLSETNSQASDLFVRSTITAGGLADISLAFSEARVPAAFAEDALHMLCATISLLTSAFVMEPLMLQSLNDNTASPHGPPRIPLPAAPRSPAARRSGGEAAQAVAPDLASAVHDVVSSGWEAVLQAPAASLRGDVRAVPFYDLWGSLLPAVELSRHYTECLRGSSITVSADDVIGAPTMMKQYEMLIAKLQQAQGQALPALDVALVRGRSSLSPTLSLRLPLRALSKAKHCRRSSLVPASGGHDGLVGAGLPSLPMGTPSSYAMPSSPLSPAAGVANSAARRQQPQQPQGHRRNGDSGASMESMTTGSSQSDEDELREGGASPSAGAGASKKWNTTLMVKKARDSALIRMKLGGSS